MKWSAYVKGDLRKRTLLALRGTSEEQEERITQVAVSGYKRQYKKGGLIVLRESTRDETIGDI